MTESEKFGDTIDPSSSVPDVLVAIVNYGTPQLVIDCLRSLAEERGSGPTFRVVVADNASPDDSVPRLQGAVLENGWGAWVEIRALSRNGGFAYGNNSVIADVLACEVAPRFIWLLNSDTFVRAGALKALTDFMDRMPRAGIVGSRLEDRDGTPQLSAFRFHSVLSEFEASLRFGPVTRLLDRWRVAPPIVDTAAAFDWVSGASMLIRLETLRETGLMDEAFFLYYEETDLCRRARQVGWDCWYVPSSRVVHLVGNSTGVTNRAGRRRRRAGYWFHSRQLYFLKHHGPMKAIATDVAVFVGTALWLLRARLQGKQMDHPEKFLLDIVRHNFFWSRFWRHARR